MPANTTTRTIPAYSRNRFIPRRVSRGLADGSSSSSGGMHPFLALAQVGIEIVALAAQLVAHSVGGEHEELTVADGVDDALPDLVRLRQRVLGRTHRELLADEPDLLQDVRHHAGGTEARHADA